MRAIIESEVRCEVVNPLIEISEKEINFTYVWVRNEQPSVLKKEITLRNISTIALNFYLKTETPFNLSCYDFSLQPGQAGNVTVDFDPLYQDSRTSHTLDRFLTIVYRSHPTREKIRVVSEVVFPNLAFESQEIDFGCFLNDTSKRICVRITNTSSVPAEYEWVFSEPADALGKNILRLFSYFLFNSGIVYPHVSSSFSD
jgi:hydrocephalus-inducing protein